MCLKCGFRDAGIGSSVQEVPQIQGCRDEKTSLGIRVLWCIAGNFQRAAARTGLRFAAGPLGSRNRRFGWSAGRSRSACCSGIRLGTAPQGRLNRYGRRFTAGTPFGVLFYSDKTPIAVPGSDPRDNTIGNHMRPDRVGDPATAQHDSGKDKSGQPRLQPASVQQREGKA